MKRIIALTLALAANISPLYATKFTLAEVKNSTTTDLILKINNNKFLEIPAHTAIRNAIELPIRTDTFGNKHITGKPEFVTRNNELVAYISGERLNNLASINLWSPMGASLAQWETKSPGKEKNDTYVIRIHFIVDSEGEIVSATEKLDVTR